MITAGFYRFFPFPDCAAWRKKLAQCLCRHSVKGTILLAPEGINGTISGEREQIDEVLALLRGIPKLERLEPRISECEAHPFKRAKVKLKREIIPFGLACDPAVKTAQHVDALEWNRIISDPETILLDARNAFEVALGSFEGAIDPKTAHFRDLAPYVERHMAHLKDRPIATFCTGGVRCEKLTSWMMEQGFTRLYQLEGGILGYLQNCPPDQNRWRGKCFIFDEREFVEP